MSALYSPAFKYRYHYEKIITFFFYIFENNEFAQHEILLIEISRLEK